LNVCSNNVKRGGTVRGPGHGPGGATGDESATERLREEHVLILRVAGVLERLAQRSELRGETDFEAFEDCIDFVRLYADACHHGKEEDLLFPALESQGMPGRAGPIAVMLEEHRQGREYARHMRNAIEPARAGDEDALRRLRNAARGYVALIRGHILKEDNVLFEMADRMVRGPACRSLCGGYDAVCARHFEGRSKVRLEQLAADLVRRVPEPD
jgi:hemerythrin-like domain-containing protein